MPPKTGGRGGRGRGRGRGGAKGGASSARTPQSTPTVAPPDQSETAAASEITDSKPNVERAEGQDAAPTTEASTGARASAGISLSSTSSPQTVAGSPAPSSLQRVNSLKGAEPASRSASPAARRGASSRGKKPTVKPTFTGRRSKTERDALEKLGRERDKERQKEREDEEKAKARDRRLRERGNNRRGRGGYTGPASGPFSLGHITNRDKRSSNRMIASGSRATRVKNEDGEDEPGPSKPRLSKSSGGPTIKREDGGHNSSEDEDDEDQVERRNIDEMIVISSDDEQTGASNRVPKSHGLLPVRIGRREHQDRVIGINTEASSAASAKILQQAEASGKAIKVEADAVVPRKSKGKGKAKDVEITGERRPYKGMWQDADDSAMQVKSEPLSDEEMIDAVPLGNSEAPPGEDAGKKTKSKKKKKKDKKSKNKKRKSRTNGIPIPVLQTDEDRAEWKRYKESLELARLMLGPKKKGKEKEKEKLVDAAGDTTMKEAGAESNEKQANEDDEVYLFHFPSNMPKPLSDITIKTEPSESEKPVAKPGKAGDAKDPKVGDDKAAIRKPRAVVVPPGLAGKLRVHKSGRITLKWGRQKFDVRPGHPTSFVEGTVNVETVPPSMRIVREEAGESVPYGALKEKFTVMPNWDQMLRY